MDNFHRRWGIDAEELTGSLVGLGYFLTGSLSEAEDLAQETLVRLLTQPPGPPPDDPKAYARTALRRLLFDQLRRRYRLRIDPADPFDLLMDREDGLPSAEDEALRADPEGLHSIEAEVARLSAQQRWAVTIRLGLDDGSYEVKPYAHVAAVMGVTEDNARAHVAAAKRRLKALLGNHREDAS